jgi:hypothetical protein
MRIVFHEDSPHQTFSHFLHFAMLFVLRRHNLLVLCLLVALTVLVSTFVLRQPPVALLQVKPEETVGPPEQPERKELPIIPDTLEVEREENKKAEKEPDQNVKIIVWDGLRNMNKLINSYWKGNRFCGTIDELRETDPNVSIIFKINFGCQELFEKSFCGTGNFLALLYGIRMAAHVYQDVEVHFTCHDAEQTRNHLILPWLTGVYPARLFNERSAFPNLTPQTACGMSWKQPVGHMIKSIQHDLRLMALALVGRSPFVNKEKIVRYSPPSFRPQLSPRKNQTTAPFADVELDEAVLHFRCGDLMDSTHSSFAFMNFRGYTRHISPDVKSIGILTQPFALDAMQARSIDSQEHIRDRCRTVVYSLVEYIQKRFPQALVRIHNEESIALSYARMILAKQAISGISTFGVMPAAATFGTGYIRIPDHIDEVNQWILKPNIDELVDNIILIQDPKIPVGHIKTLWEQEGERGVLAWFWNDTWTAEE